MMSLKIFTSYSINTGDLYTQLITTKGLWIAGKRYMMIKFNNKKHQILIEDGSVDKCEIMRRIVESKIQEDAFYVFDGNDIIKKLHSWTKKLPRVHPHYAVKCNSHSLLLKMLAALGVGFDCASKEEIEKILSLGVDPKRIVFSNPTKMPSHIKYAARKSVMLTVFDNEYELQKIKNDNPTTELLLRIRCDVSHDKFSMNSKFGCEMVEAPRLLKAAQTLSLNVVGICFHIGSDSNDPLAFGSSIKAAKKLFKIGRNLGFSMKILDIGGGFPGHDYALINNVMDDLNKSLDRYFPEHDDVTIIAEPGRYFAESAFTLATQIYSLDCKWAHDEPCSDYIYYINDGIYGSFGDSIYCSKRFTPCPLTHVSTDEKGICTIYGHSINEADIISDELVFPKMSVGDWLYFSNMGAYTLVFLDNIPDSPKVYSVFTRAVV